MRTGNVISLLAVSCLAALAIPRQATAQHGQYGLFFYQLNTSHGLSDNYIHSMAIDSSGNLWVGTGDGLNMFNGKTVVKFFRQEYPQMSHNYIRQLVCDQTNRIWLLTYDRNVTVIDEDRRFHRVMLKENGEDIPVRMILYPAEAGMILYAEDRHYRLKPDVDITRLDSLTADQFDLLTVEGADTLFRQRFRQIEPFDAQRYVFTLGDRFYVVNYVSKQIERIIELPDIYVLTRWGDDKLLARNENTKMLTVINLTNGTQEFPFDTIRDQHGLPIDDDITNAREIRQDEYLLTSRSHGLYIYTSTAGQLAHYTHNAADPNSVVSNVPWTIAVEKNGWVFLGATPSGVSYFKSDAVIGQQAVFMDARGHNFDGPINAVTTRDNDTYFIGTSEYLIKWKRSVNTSEFIRYDGRTDLDPGDQHVFYLEFDRMQRLWVSVYQKGIYILDKNFRLVKHLVSLPGIKDVLPANNVRHLLCAPDGKMWCASDAGVCRIDPVTFQVDQFQGHPLEKLDHSFCYRLFFADPDNVWVATSSKGAWHYTLSTDSVEIHDTKNGLLTNEVFCFNKDRNGNMYVGTVAGLQILLADGGTKTITVNEGLMNNRVEALLLDKHNRMWMGNDVGLSCFSIADSSLKVFDERYGLSIYGFRLASYHQNPDDELIWGTEKGLQYFYPDRLLEQTVSFPATINRIETRDVVRNLTQDATLRLSPANNYVTFYFTSIDYSKHLRTFYSYQLEGLDPGWTKVVDQNSVRYNSLPPGKYTFRVRASNDDRVWEDAGNTVTITIDKPVWQRLWFRALALLGSMTLIWYLIQTIRARQRARQEELETQVVINYFASRINSYRKTEDLLWDVAENCISRLHFEDCVIYLVDKDRNVLVQKAAYGPKMEKAMTNGRVDFTVHEPIEIPVGKGIVGTVAQSGIPELIADTTADSRYIVDDKRRRSELAVPMLIDNEVIGVIDSEHSRRQFFTQKHMSILKTIAALCANQIQRVRAEDEKQQAMIEVLKNKQKVTESRLQSLRLQMNPHFLFNALNSIQQMILANEEMVATRYLSRFSKLLRTILVHSDKEMVTLKEELDILNLYVDLESIRFKQAFEYEITCDDELDIDEIKIPTLLIQPFVENAIWHGLMHKEGDRHLSVTFFEEDDVLFCIIEDNGIGREKAREMKLSTGHGTNHTSKGIAVSVERLKSIYNTNGQSGSMEITDLKDPSGNAAGTRVEIHFPMQN